MSDASRPPILVAQDKWLASEGVRRWGKGQLWAQTFYTFSKNGLELRDLLKHYEDPSRAMAGIIESSRPGSDQLRADNIRLLHNFLAAACTLVAHTRNFMRELYAGDPILSEYEQKVKDEFAGSPLVQFVHDLRNYTLHKGVPLVSETMRFETSGPPQFAVALDVARMRRWRKWTPLARAFMDEHGDRLRIAAFVEPYLDKVARFHHWHTGRRKEVDKPVRQEMERLQREYITLRDSSKKGKGGGR